MEDNNADLKRHIILSTGKELDSLVAEIILGWKLTEVGPDISGQNNCEILTQNGMIEPNFELPTKGLIKKWYLVPDYHTDLFSAMKISQRVGILFVATPVIEERKHTFIGDLLTRALLRKIELYENR